MLMIARGELPGAFAATLSAEFDLAQQFFDIS
jgi:hypothetical protein